MCNFASKIGQCSDPGHTTSMAEIHIIKINIQCLILQAKLASAPRPRHTTSTAEIHMIKIDICVLKSRRKY